jgi:hypothetical protein
MKCTTRQTTKGALEGTPFTPIWLKRFSEIAPISAFNLLSRTCKRIHQHLRLNVVWKDQCRKLPEFKELSDYERNTWMAMEGFWYEWWQDRVVRTIPRLVPPAVVTGWAQLGPGTICQKVFDGQDAMKKPCVVIISNVVSPTAKRNGHFYIANTVNTIGDIIETDVVRFTMLTKFKVSITPSHGTSVNLSTIP